MNFNRRSPACSLLGLVLLAVGAFGCSSDDPTTPSTGGGPGVPSGGGTPGATWNIQVTATPNVLQLPVPGTGDPAPTSFVRFVVRNAANGQPPPNNTTLVVSATGGTLSGDNFTGQTQVNVLLLNGEATLIFTPTGEGTALIRAQLETSVGTATIQVLGAPDALPFAISNVTPPVGGPQGGFAVRIGLEEGSQPFVGPVRVTIGGQTADVLEVTPGFIRVRVPALATPLGPGETRVVDVTVTNAFGTAAALNDTLIGGFVYAHGGSVDTPVVFSVDPTSGPLEGNTRITIRGAGFVDPQVLFQFPSAGGTIQIDAPLESVKAATQLIVRSPDIRSYVNAGTLITPVSAIIRVINRRSGASFLASANPFVYGTAMRITSISPSEVDFRGGEDVVITGNGFDEPVVVAVGGIGQTVIDVTGTRIRFRTTRREGLACDARSLFPVTVTNEEGGGTVTFDSLLVTGPESPEPTSVSPSAGNVGISVTIAGRDFPPAGTSNVRVNFGGEDGSTAPVNSAPGNNTLVVTVPTPPLSFEFATEACDGNGDGIAGGTRPVPTPIDVTVTDLDSGCSGTLTNAFTLNPQSAACTGDNTAPPPPPTVACNDGVDNDGDGAIDFPADLGCSAADDTNEIGQCQDGVDNDADTFIDFGPGVGNDPQCASLNDNTEGS
jgi:hypothetical protein